MDVMQNSYMPGDQRLVDEIVYELKSQGIFDQFRKECIADVDTKPAYQNLRQRVEGSVSGFLKKQTWKPDMNKNHVREMLRKNIYESGFLETGVERIVDQVVNPKINTVFLPQVEDVVYRFLGIEKPHRSNESRSFNTSLKINIFENLLPTDLEAVSPESDICDEKSDKIDESGEADSKIDDDESPPFEPLEGQSLNMSQEENSVDSHLSGFSGLVSHDSNHSQVKSQQDVSNQDSQQSKPSSESRMSISMSDDNDTKLESVEELQAKSSKANESDSNQALKTHEGDDKKQRSKSSEKHRSRDRDRKDDRKDRKEHKDAHSSSRSKDKNRDRKDSKSRNDKEKSSKYEKDKESRHEKSEGDKEKDKNKHSSSKHRTSSRKEDRKDSHSSSSKETSKSSSSNRTHSKSKPEERNGKSDKNRRNEKHKHVSSSKDKKDHKKDPKREIKDDHFSSKNKKHSRRSTDRDSNDGHSGNKSSTSSLSESVSSQQHKQNEQPSEITSRSADSGNSDGVDKISRTSPQMLKIIKPKLATSIHEMRSVMKIRKELGKMEKKGQFGLDLASRSVVNSQENCSDEKMNLDAATLSPEKSDIAAKAESPELIPPPLQNSIITKESWDALEAKLNQDLINVNYNSYEDYSEQNCDDYELKETKKPNGKKVVPTLEETKVSYIPTENEEDIDINSMTFRTTTKVHDQDDEECGPICSCFEHALPATTKEFLKFAVAEIAKLEKSLVLKEPPQNEKKATKKRPSNERNNNKKTEGTKRKRMNSKVSNLKRTKIVDATDLVQNGTFSLPLSPAESEKSDKKPKAEVSPVKSLSKLKMQRYSSDDLYKPRPLFSGSRRRGKRNAQVE